MSKRERSFYVMKVTGDAEAWGLVSVMLAKWQIANCCLSEEGWEELKYEYLLDDPTNAHVSCTLHTFSTVELKEQDLKYWRDKHEAGYGHITKHTSYGYILVDADDGPDPSRDDCIVDSRLDDD